MRPMRNPAFERILALSSTPVELESTVQYFSDCLKPIVGAGENVLICFPRVKATDLGAMAESAVIRCGGVPVFWENDLRWKELLRLAFVSKATTIIAPPLIILGLAKLAAFRGIPLYFYHAVMAGYPCLDWMMDGIEKGLDCKIWGGFGPGTEALLTGFSCDCGRGVHIRDDKYGVEIVDSQGQELRDGENGHIVIYHKDAPEARFETRAFGSVMSQRCPCGNSSPKLIGIDVGEYRASSLLKIAEDLLYWNSILDCRLKRSEFGLEMEIICFRGEKMPKLPTCAKLIVRDWDPESDIPLSLSAGWTTP